MPRPNRITIQLTSDQLGLVGRCYDSLHPGHPSTPTAKRVTQVLLALLDHWDTAQEIFSGREEKPVQLPTSIETALRELTDPDVSVKLNLSRSTASTPRDTSGLVPWDYIAAGYSKLSFIEPLLSDEAVGVAERRDLLRIVLSRIPEETWESEHTRSVVERALLQVGPGLQK